MSASVNHFAVTSGWFPCFKQTGQSMSLVSNYKAQCDTNQHDLPVLQIYSFYLRIMQTLELKCSFVSKYAIL